MPPTAHDVLDGGGEMGAAMRATDWAATPVGTVETWPQSLRTAVSILLESRFPMYIAWGPTFVQFYNDGYRPILGSTKHPAALGRGARETFAESWHIIGPMFEGVRNGTAVGSEDWMLPLDRHGYLEECYFTFSYSPVRDESGGVGGVLVTVTETTGRVLGERRLRTLRSLAARTGGAQRQGEAWQAAAQALEANPHDLPFALLYELDADRGQCALVAASGWAETPKAVTWPFSDEAARNGGLVVTDLGAKLAAVPGGAWPEPPASALVLAIARPGSEQPYGFLVAGVSPRRALDDDYRGFLRLVADQIASALGAARSYEDEKKRAEALAEIDRAKTAFFSNVSHEFRTPLTLMLGPIEDGLADTEVPLPPAQRERQQLIRRNGLRLQKLVNTLLDFARIEAGRAEAAFVPTDLATFTVELASSFDSAFAKAEIGLDVSCPPLPEAVFVDPTMWEKIVLNLLSNALKFTFRGTVRVWLEWLGDAVALHIRDTGTGIPEEELPRIFDRFHRIEGARGRSHEGTGIGLALVRELITLHGGTVDVTSKLGEGSTFTVRIPTGTAHLPADRVRRDTRTLTSTGIGPASFLAEISQWNEPAAPLPRDATTERARILVADDNADMRVYLTRLLSPRWDVEAVSDGEAALAAARERVPDLVLADVMMPGLDGLGLVRALRANDRTRTIAVVLLSARAGEEATIEGLQSGADGYLVKPFSATELIARVHAQLAVARLRHEAVRVEREHSEETSRLLIAAERATHAREDTLAVVTHDLRTPLSAITTAAELLAATFDETDTKRRKRVDTIRSAADRMNRLLADLLDSASIDAGTLSIDPHAHHASEVVREVRELFEPLAAQKGVALRFDVDADAPAATFDQERIVQVLSNLMSNALKFTPAGGTIGVRVTAASDAVQFSVTDTGPGVADAARTQIFDRHWHRATGNRDGHGLGLFIASSLVALHGGRLGLDETSPRGSTFSFTLPLVARAAPAIAKSAGAYATAPDTDDSFVRGGGECGALIRAFDWSTTCLGPMSEWPQSLRTSVSTMLRSPYPITLFWGRDLAMLYNDPFRPIHGDKHPATMGASAPQALAEAWGILGPLVEQTLATGEPLFVQNGAVFFARAPGGQREEAYFTWSYNPTIGETGGIAGLFAIASETTRQVLGDRRLAVLRELSLRTAFDKNVAGVFVSVEAVLAQAGADLPFALLYVVDPDARLVSCAGLARGLAPSPLAPTTDAPWPVGEVARSRSERLVTELAAIGPLPGGPHTEPATRALVLPVPIGADDGAMGVLVVGLSPLLPLDDDYRSFLQLLARQISASVASARAYEEESQRAEKLAQLDRAKTDFFSNVSHEFRTPLTLILGPVEDALAKPTRSLAGNQLALVRRNALRLYKMVNALLDFSRIEAGRAQATFVPTDLAAFTASLASHFQSAAASAGLRLVVDCPPLPDAIYVDPEMWEKIVLNLISNAVKYTHHGEVRVAVTTAASSAIVTVEDTGVGISASELPHIFERFYRVQESHGRSHEGTGIGLALARELVELHGGTITATSELGTGTTVTIEMPRGTAHLPAERVDRTARPRSTASGAAAYVEEALRWSAEKVHAETAPLESGPTPLPAALGSSRILLVDDNADLRAYVAGILGPLFPQVESANHGREALERARVEAFDLVISDVMMPVMDGFELVRELRADPRTAAVPIILLSARAGEEATVEGLDSGADDYLVKPFSARELLARVRSQLEMSRARADVWKERGKVETLERSVAARDEFIAISSHELRTPLTALQIQIESLLSLAHRGDATTERTTTKLGIALRQVERLTRLVESLLDASRASLDVLDLEREDLDLAELAKAVVARVEDDARASGTSFRMALSPTIGRWDRARLDGVLTGLVSNAMKYAAGTVIDIVVTSERDVATVIVRDSGVGIAPHDVERVFEPFERGVSHDSYGGFGIGLFLAKKIVVAHGGSLAAAATQGGGATLTVTLPRGQP